MSINSESATVEKKLRSGRSVWADSAKTRGNPLKDSIHADVVVVGAGVSGAFMAHALAKRFGKIVVVAPYDADVALERVPANVQSATAEDIERLQALDVTDFLRRDFGSVSINHAQNNPLQPDVTFRGFTASPLLGLSPGFTVYQNGVRINEPFGDTVNWT